jgi:predicted ATPase
MKACECQDPHERRRIVLTGGPGAGKTAVLELVRQYFCKHVDVLPEAASILFGGGFRRATSTQGRQAAQRAIFHVQHELETVALAEGNPAIVLCDRGTVDGFAYWPGPSDFWKEVATSRDQELKRYDAVIHLRTPTATGGYNHRNPVRIESAAEAAVIDQRIVDAWGGHPRRFIVESAADFLSKAQQAIEILRGEMPECCRRHLVPSVDQRTTGVER